MSLLLAALLLCAVAPPTLSQQNKPDVGVPCILYLDLGIADPDPPIFDPPLNTTDLWLCFHLHLNFSIVNHLMQNVTSPTSDALFDFDFAATEMPSNVHFNAKEGLELNHIEVQRMSTVDATAWYLLIPTVFVLLPLCVSAFLYSVHLFRAVIGPSITNADQQMYCYRCRQVIDLNASHEFCFACGSKVIVSRRPRTTSLPSWNDNNNTAS